MCLLQRDDPPDLELYDPRRDLVSGREELDDYGGLSGLPALTIQNRSLRKAVINPMKIALFDISGVREANKKLPTKKVIMKILFCQYHFDTIL